MPRTRGWRGSPLPTLRPLLASGSGLDSSPLASLLSCQLVVSGREVGSRLAMVGHRWGARGGPAKGRGWRREKGAVGPSAE